jgi:hypothetical protein
MSTGTNVGTWSNGGYFCIRSRTIGLAARFHGDWLLKGKHNEPLASVIPNIEKPSTSSTFPTLPNDSCDQASRTDSQGKHGPSSSYHTPPITHSLKDSQRPSPQITNMPRRYEYTSSSCAQPPTTLVSTLITRKLKPRDAPVLAHHELRHFLGLPVPASRRAHNGSRSANTSGT